MVLGAIMGVVLGLRAVNVVGQYIANDGPSHYAYVNNEVGRSSHLMNKKIAKVEIRYCHINGVVSDFALTLTARLSSVTSQAAHHHFVILTLESGEYIYIDKHAERNIMVRNDKRGKNGDGNQWLESEQLKEYHFGDGSNRTLRDVIRYVEQDSDGDYNLIVNNCQHFAQSLYMWI